jgi:hypothetical protein
MNQKGIAIAAILAATMLRAVFTTPPTFSLKSAEGQSLTSCPVGYHRNVLGICVPNVITPPDTLPTSENRTEQNIICSGFSYTCG